VTLNAEKGMQVKDGELLASIQKTTE
jgi:hypothetical protein